ncbi:MAG TPA: copper chaperone PCu(A)C [Streptosporangiaceae bacterium]|nr:copper chaperone PCu(A)C [Streptosporangiaceae bacterium]
MTGWSWGHRRRVIAAALAACALTVAAAGCTARVAAAPSLTVTSAYVPLPLTAAPHTTVAFLDIRNDGAADRLVAARTSVGGTVVFREPTGQGTRMRTVAAISIPAASTVRLLPNDAHLLISGAGPLRGGKDITLVLTFARAGTVSVTAQVTDPQSGGGSYFTN